MKNGTILVLVATVITVILMVMTDRDEKIPNAHENITILENETAQIETLSTESLSVETIPAEIKPGEAESAKSENTEVKQMVLDAIPTTEETGVQVEGALPPEGPFIKPKTELNKAVSQEANIPKTTSTQHDLLNHITQPIWMDQKLGDFKSVEKGDVVFKMIPTSPNGLQGENPEQVVTSKTDKFLPALISSTYYYQQMPMYNGGYYIAPMPSYLMPSVLPGNVIFDNKNQDQD